jgi:uncharacterized Fe-S cluster-containing radical SAM superfamily protein
MAYIDTDTLSAKLRERAIDINRKAILINNFTGSSQEKDITDSPNCKGYGRVRHFKLHAGNDWVLNPLPILPAAKALGIEAGEEIRAQVFQSSVCNWRCWYCFVDSNSLRGNLKHASFLTCDEMLDLYLNQDNPPKVLDLTGGQPDLTPEWVFWMMEAIIKRGLENKIFLWSDDNLSNDYLRTYLTEDQIHFMAIYKLYSRVCCFKGIDERTFSLNTNADPKLFENQFLLSERLLNLGFDLYFYLTLVSPTITDYKSVIPRFLDRIQKVHELLPLRTVPLKLFKYTPVEMRMDSKYADMFNGQLKAVDIWKTEIQKRFSTNLLNTPISEISLNNRL